MIGRRMRGILSWDPKASKRPEGRSKGRDGGGEGRGGGKSASVAYCEAHKNKVSKKKTHR